MPWNPTKKVINLTPIAGNLRTYILANDADALAWANGGTPLDQFAEVYTNASGRLPTVFPNLLVLTQENETDLSGEILVAGFQITLEGAVSGPDPDALVLTTKKYANAVESMLANIPSADFSAGASPAMNASLFEIETRLDIIRGTVSPSAFVQVFQTRAVYQITAAAF